MFGLTIVFLQNSLGYFFEHFPESYSLQSLDSRSSNDNHGSAAALAVVGPPLLGIRCHRPDDWHQYGKLSQLLLRVGRTEREAGQQCDAPVGTRAHPPRLGPACMETE